MPGDPKDAFRAQAEGVFTGGAGFLAYFLHAVASRLEVATEGDRILVVVCTIGAILSGAAFALLAGRAWLRQRRARAAAAVDPPDEDAAG